MKLIKSYRKVLRFWSVQLNIIGTLLLSIIVSFPDVALFVWNNFPNDLKAYFPQEYLPLISVTFFVMAIFARMVKQTEIGDDDD